MSEEKISDQLLKRFKEMVDETIGLSYPDSKNAELLAKLPKIQRSFHYPDIVSCIHYLTSKPLTEHEVTRLAKELTIPETYFFRNSNTYEALEKNILPHIIEQKRKEKNKRLRLWSAGCCTGEEPYSLAILLHELLPDLCDWSVELLATDINQDYLEKAKRGLYKPWSFRGTPKKVIQKYFEEKEAKTYQIRPQILRMVRFSYLNLMQCEYGIEKVDLLLCNHVLIYFSTQHIRQVIEKLYQALHPTGRLLVSAVEVPFIDHRDLEWEKVKDTIFFKKKIGDSQKPTLPTDKKKIIFQSDHKDSAKAFHRLESSLETNKAIYSSQKNSEQPTVYISIKKLADENKLEEALQECKNALSNDRVDYMLHYLQSVILHEMGDTEQAVQAIKQSLFLKPSFVMGHFFLGMQLLQIKRYKEAHKEIENALDLLKGYEPQAILPGSEEMSADRLRFIVEGVLKR